MAQFLPGLDGSLTGAPRRRRGQTFAIQAEPPSSGLFVKGIDEILEQLLRIDATRPSRYSAKPHRSARPLFDLESAPDQILMMFLEREQARVVDLENDRYQEELRRSGGHSGRE